MAVAEGTFTIGAIALLAPTSVMTSRRQYILALHPLVLGLQTLQLFICLPQPGIEVFQLLFA